MEHHLYLTFLSCATPIGTGHQGSGSRPRPWVFPYQFRGSFDHSASIRGQINQAQHIRQAPHMVTNGGPIQKIAERSM